ncbi:(E)-4-hydroxy-3-methylbut-2-enyl-diphosphate synthase [Brumimicrobium aurantiacum]|uniref:4-hydroxy-3-methylbut-2-en-1-yl diphosphate synthase (flavodoxin) n=1 Tax=Brumimicrobium aurantiacum TaxID=1737063 RepID=A0A3E1F1X4_9FLAO|nr:(E)-4-hydroxy-3-methylbut-2-enyl-diphosphate synthase [Brumimicrobium aurantiacum]RFC55832.1 4-hydroxy-3-methylbut-2-en-1-yl diphosphate synthase [Brumimicrobium aurantiacum]
MKYCYDPFNRSRLKTEEVMVGKVGIGGENPIRIQSMTTKDTMDTEGSIEESIRMIDVGCELVRLTAPSKKEAHNLAEIKKGLIERGYDTPLVADIHFTPNAAEIAAGIVEKVRVNPGNYADKKKFEEIEYTDESYKAELDRIEEKFTPLVKLCKENGTAMRIGTNHGSLSDRILSRFGDTPEGMVESAMEFIHICQKNDFHDFVISMKASNTLVMVQAYRFLVARMLDEGKIYPLHLGVTEAGDGEDGRIKSAVGIGALLEDGLGDTIRVSLTEAPEAEIPVAEKLAYNYKEDGKQEFPTDLQLPYNPLAYQRRASMEVHNIGGSNHPIVFANLSGKDEISPANFFGFGYNYSKVTDKWSTQDLAADFVFIGDKTVDFEIPGMLGVVASAETWKDKYSNKKHFYPLYETIPAGGFQHESLNFLQWDPKNTKDLDQIQFLTDVVLIVEAPSENFTQVMRNFYRSLVLHNIDLPIILKHTTSTTDMEAFQLWHSAKLGSVLIDGFGDGVWIESTEKVAPQLVNTTSFGILQATRTRISKTEYISCPSCGRTLFDLQETTAKIRKSTSHLKGVKIGIMGCIVNGPGEMADADYGYVGTRPGKIHLYKEKTVVKKNVPEEEAVEALIDLIKENGDWIAPK